MLNSKRKKILFISGISLILILIVLLFSIFSNKDKEIQKEETIIQKDSVSEIKSNECLLVEDGSIDDKLNETFKKALANTNKSSYTPKSIRCVVDDENGLVYKVQVIDNKSKKDSYYAYIKVKNGEGTLLNDELTSKKSTGYIVVENGATEYVTEYVEVHHHHQGDPVPYPVPVFMPTKGNVISLGDNNNYKILYVDGTEALVLSMSDINSDLIYSDGTSTTTFTDGNGNETVGVKYQSSNIDKYLEEKWYNDLKTSNPKLYSSIKETSIFGKQYDYTDEPNNSYQFSDDDANLILYKYKIDDSNFKNIIYKGNAPVITRHVFALDITDIYDYLDKSVITKEDLQSMFYDSKDVQSGSMWLASSYNESKAFCVDFENGSLTYDDVTSKKIVRPAFIIDLSSSEIQFDTNPIIKFINESGNGTTINLKIGDKVSFDAGDHGRYDIPIDPIELTSGSSFNLNDPKYIPVADTGYVFIGFIFDDTNKKFIAQYDTIVKPANTITLNDGKEYRVLKLDGSKALVMPLYSIFGDYYKNNSETPIQKTNYTDKQGSPIEGIKYDGSVLDNFLNGEGEDCFYGSLPESMRKAIVDQDVVQYLYSTKEAESIDDFDNVDYKVEFAHTDSYKDFLNVAYTNVGKKHVFNLSIKDIADYYNTNIIHSDDLKDFFNYLNADHYYVWLMDGYSDNYEQAFSAASNHFIYNDQAYETINQPYNICPVFVIDLEYEEVEYVKKYYINFDTNGFTDVPNNQEVIDGNKIIKPEDPLATGYTFIGWFKERECINLWDFENDIPNSDVTLYAKWNITIANIFPDNFPITSSVLGDISSNTKSWNTYDDQYCLLYIGSNPVKMIFQKNEKKIFLDISQPLIKDGDNYKYIKKGITFLFEMNEDKFNKIIVSGDENDENNNNINGEYTFVTKEEIIMWENDGTHGSINWTSDYRFALEGHDGNNECIKEFNQEEWNQIKIGTFYLVFSEDATAQIRITDGWWSSGWPYGFGIDISVGDEHITDNHDGTYTLEIYFDNDPILDVLDEHHLLFTGSGYTPLKLYYYTYK